MKHLFQDSLKGLVKHLFQDSPKDSPKDSSKDLAKHLFQDSPKGPAEGLAKRLREGQLFLDAAMKYDILFHRCVFQSSKR